MIFFACDARFGESDPYTYQEQLNIFCNADIIMGPHGAGLVNILYAKPGATLVEFPTDPHVNRCFGFLSLALGFSYWAVPAVMANYYSTYNMTEGQADTVIRVVENIFTERQRVATVNAALREMGLG